MKETDNLNQHLVIFKQLLGQLGLKNRNSWQIKAPKKKKKYCDMQNT